MSTKILVVTKDRAVAEEVINRFQGHDITWVQDPYTATRRIWSNEFDVYILCDELGRLDSLRAQIRKTMLVSGPPNKLARLAFWMSDDPHPERIAKTWVSNLTELELAI